MFQSLGQYDRAREYQEKALAIKTEVGVRDGEATATKTKEQCFNYSVNMTKRAREYQEKALAIPTEIGKRDAEAAGYGSLGTVFQ